VMMRSMLLLRRILAMLRVLGGVRSIWVGGVYRFTYLTEKDTPPFA
jgi:hypothetical protein